MFKMRLMRSQPERWFCQPCWEELVGEAANKRELREQSKAR